jgi:gas vesicle protein
MSFQKILIGTLGGLAAGLVIGILTAPDSGAETRKKINDKADDIKNRVRRIKHTGTQELDELSTIFRNEIQGLGENVRKRVLDLIQAVKTGTSNLNQEVNAN